MARPLLSTLVVDDAAQAKRLVRTSFERVAQEVASGAMSPEVGREVLGIIQRAADATARVKAMADELHREERRHDIGKRGGFLKPTREIRRALAELNLAVIDPPENVINLFGDDDGRVA